MRIRSCILFCTIVLITLPALSAFQDGQAAGRSTTVEKKVRSKAKKAEHTGEAAGESATNVPAKHSAATSEKAIETPKTRKAGTQTTGSAQRALPTVPESEIAAAKASGKVWVNTETGVYHKAGQWYGATKQGKFMTEGEAIKSGYRASKSK
jgi:hypothetical protein